MKGVICSLAGDERICDGFYYASVIKYFLRLLAHPEVLDRPPETIEQDIP